MNIAFFSDCYLDLTGGIVSSINAQKAALEKTQKNHSYYTTVFEFALQLFLWKKTAKKKTIKPSATTY